MRTFILAAAFASLAVARAFSTNDDGGFQTFADEVANKGEQESESFFDSLKNKAGQALHGAQHAVMGRDDPFKDESAYTKDPKNYHWDKDPWAEHGKIQARAAKDPIDNSAAQRPDFGDDDSYDGEAVPHGGPSYGYFIHDENGEPAHIIHEPAGEHWEQDSDYFYFPEEGSEADKLARRKHTAEDFQRFPEEEGEGWYDAHEDDNEPVIIHNPDPEDPRHQHHAHDAHHHHGYKHIDHWPVARSVVPDYEDIEDYGVTVDRETATNDDQYYFDIGDEGDEGPHDPTYGLPEWQRRDAKKQQLHHAPVHQPQPAHKPGKKAGWSIFPW